MSTIKVKIYKNPARDKVEVHSPYVPQYQLMGVEPLEHKSSIKSNMPDSSVSLGPKEIPKDQKSYIRKLPYAEVASLPIGNGLGLIPNVGNSIEHTWAGVDDEIVDDIYEKLDSNHPMVDNNDFVSVKALGLVEDSNYEKKTLSKPFLTENILKNALEEDNLSSIINKLEEDEYCLLVKGEVIVSGPFTHIEDQTRLLVFGEHELYNGNPVSIDDLMVIKRVKIKIGVFLE